MPRKGHVTAKQKANLRPWPKGAPSPNPKGRPRKLPQLDLLLEKLLGEENKDGVTEMELILKRLRQSAKKNDNTAAEMLLKRAYGDVKKIELSGPQGGPIETESSIKPQTLQQIEELLYKNQTPDAGT